MKNVIVLEYFAKRYADGNRPTTGMLDEVLEVPVSRMKNSSCSRQQRQCVSSNLSTRAVRHPSGHANGQTVTKRGVVFTCETLNRRITAANPDDMNTTTIVVDSFRGKPLNSPNDIVEKRDGTIWFTDPEYGCEEDQFPNPSCPSLPNNVYRLDLDTMDVVPVAGESAGVSLDRPNGLAFSVDESLLYIIDSGKAMLVCSVCADKRKRKRGEWSDNRLFFRLVVFVYQVPFTTWTRDISPVARTT